MKKEKHYQLIVKDVPFWRRVTAYAAMRGENKAELIFRLLKKELGEGGKE